MRRHGLEVEDQPEDVYARYVDRNQVFVAPAALSGVAAFVLLTIVWSDFPWIVSAAALGWIAWALNEARVRHRA